MYESFIALLLGLPLAALANWQLIETWHHGSIFDTPRAWFEARGGFFADLILCPFCLSHWTSWLCVLPLFYTFDPSMRLAGLIPFFALATTRLSNVLNDVSRGVTRTPNRRGMESALQLTLERLQNECGPDTDTPGGPPPLQ